MKTKQINYTKGSFLSVFNQLRELKKDFSIEYTGYTRAIKYTEKKQPYLLFFADEQTSFKTFQANKKIIKEIKQKEFNFEPFDLDKINYFNFNEKIKPQKKCVCIDLNNAYPQALKNAEIISEETFNNLMQLKKSERLKAIGMLATLKTKVQFKGGEVAEFDTVRGEYSNYYFICQKIVGDLIAEIRHKFPDKFLFFWFDGIFLQNTNEKDVEFIQNYFNFAGFPTKVEQIENLHVSENKNNLIYFKDGKRKILPIIKKEKIIFTNKFKNLKIIK